MTDPTDFSSLPDPLDGAREAIAQLERAVAAANLSANRLPDAGVSCNLVLGFGDDGYVLVTVVVDNEVSTYLTTGAAADLGPDRLATLEFANARTRENPALPTFVHDAEGGTDLLVQQSHPTALLVQNPEFLRAMIQANVQRTVTVREALAATDLGGRPYEAEAEDLQRLAQRAIV